MNFGKRANWESRGYSLNNYTIYTTQRKHDYTSSLVKDINIQEIQRKSQGMPSLSLRHTYRYGLVSRCLTRRYSWEQFFSSSLLCLCTPVETCLKISTSYPFSRGVNPRLYKKFHTQKVWGKFTEHSAQRRALLLGPD